MGRGVDKIKGEDHAFQTGEMIVVPKANSVVSFYHDSALIRGASSQQELDAYNQKIKDAFKKSPQSQGYADSMSDALDSPLNPHLQIYLPWGFDNLFPNSILALNARNSASGALIRTKVDFIAGKIFLYKEHQTQIPNSKETIKEVEVVRNSEIEDFLDENETELELQKWTSDYETTGNFFLELTPNVNKNKIVAIKHIDMTLCRVGEVLDGQIVDYCIADWLHYQADMKRILAFDKNNIAKADKFIYHGKNYFSGSHFYGMPTYIGAEFAVRLLNEIFTFHLANLRNQFNIKYHIEIPYTYLDDVYGKNGKNIQQGMSEIMTKMDDFLASSNNSGKSLLTYFHNNHMGQPKDLFKITPIKSEINDKAYSDLFDQATIAVCSAHGVNPALAGVIIKDKTLTSGSELENAYNMHLKLKVPSSRNAVLMPLKRIAKINKWDKDIKFGIEDVVLTTVDQKSKKGTEDVKP